MADALTECIGVLVARGVVRLVQLEILLLLAGDNDRAWTTRAVASGVTAEVERTAALLDGLARCGLLSVGFDDANGAVVRLDERLDLGALRALRTTYLRDRSRVADALVRGGLIDRPRRGPATWRSV